MTTTAAPSPIVVAASHFSAGRLDEAERGCAAILGSKPRHFDALQLLGIIRCRRGDLPGGLRCFDAALAVDPASHDALVNRGNALLSMGRFDEALASFDRATASQPATPDLLNSRGNVLLAMGRYEEALGNFESALSGRPQHAGLLKNRGNAQAALGRFEAALASYDEALRLQPADVGTWNNRGNVMRAMGRADEALASYDRAAAIQPLHVETLTNRGIALHALQRLDDAIAGYGQALAIHPGHAAAHWNLALALLAKNDFARGWREYEWRWQLPSRYRLPDYPAPRWTGKEDVRGKTVLLHAEQGLGDTLQFCRYADAMVARGARVILQVDRPLVRLLSTLDGISLVAGLDEALPPFDFHIPMLSLPLALATTPETIPVRIPYLRADPKDVATWEARLGARRMPRIGLAWAGNPSQAKDRDRSMPLASLASLLALPVQFVSLQKEMRDADAAELARHAGLLHFGPELGDFADTAALAQCCDLVIAVNSSVAHLAGAIGKPVWIPLPFAPDWRFVVGRDDSAWYPTAKLFWQSRPGEWGEVVGRMVMELNERRTGDLGLGT